MHNCNTRNNPVSETNQQSQLHKQQIDSNISFLEYENHETAHSALNTSSCSSTVCVAFSCLSGGLMIYNRRFKLRIE